MNKTIKKKWVAALRSGKYKQTQGRLKSQRGHCCLGVLCEVVGLEPEYDPEIKKYHYEYESETLPKPVERFSGLDNDDILGTLTAMNDGEYYEGFESLDPKRYSFKQIADYIEENL